MWKGKKRPEDVDTSVGILDKAKHQSRRVIDRQGSVKW